MPVRISVMPRHTGRIGKENAGCAIFVRCLGCVGFVLLSVRQAPDSPPDRRAVGMNRRSTIEHLIATLNENWVVCQKYSGLH